MKTRSGKKYQKTLRRVRYQSQNSLKVKSQSHRKRHLRRDFDEKYSNVNYQEIGNFEFEGTNPNMANAMLNQDPRFNTPVRVLDFTGNRDSIANPQARNSNLLIEEKSPRRVPRSQNSPLTRVDVHRNTNILAEDEKLQQESSGSSEIFEEIQALDYDIERGELDSIAEVLEEDLQYIIPPFPLRF